jgi:hypothetical protein
VERESGKAGDTSIDDGVGVANGGDSEASEGAAGRRSEKRSAEVWDAPESGAIVMEIYARRRHRANE